MDHRTGDAGEPIDALLARANTLRAAGDQAGVAPYTAILRQNPRHFHALMGLGLLARARGDAAAALEFIQSALAIRPEENWALDALLGLHRDAGRWAEASAAAQAMLVAKPRHIAALMTLGLAARAGEDRATALSWFSLAALAHPENAWAAEAILTEHRDHRRWLLAENAAHVVLAHQPGNLGALMTLGLGARARGDAAAAQGWLERAVEAAPQNVWALDQLLRSYLDAARWPEADAIAQTVLAERPGHMASLIARGMAARAAGDLPKAAEWFEAACDSAPADLWPRDLLMWLRRDLGDLAAADRLADASLHGNAGYVPALVARGLNARDRGETARAIEVLRAAVAVAPDNPSPRHALAETLRRQGAFEEAEALLRVSLEKAPQDWTARLELARLREAQGDLDGAIAWLRADAQPGPPVEFGVAHARMLVDNGEAAAARSVLEPVLAEQPHHLHALLVLAKAEQARGDNSAAKNALRLARQFHPARLEPMLELAALLWEGGDAAAAQALLDEARQTAPTDPRPLEAAARQARHAEKPALAAELHRAAMALNPRSASAHAGLIDALAGAGQADAAQQAGRAAETLLGPLPWLRVARVAALHLRGHWPEALAMARAPVTPGDGMTMLRLWQARLELLLHGPEMASATLAGITPRRAGERAEHLLLQGLLAEAGWDIDRAAAIFREGLKMAIEHPGVAWNAARNALMRLDIEGVGRELQVAMAHGEAARQLTGRSGNLSQSHAGQVMDEFSLDEALLGDLQRLRMVPAGERTAPLAELVRDNPDSTAAACQLVVALRQAGRLAPGSTGGGAAIPRRFCQYWSDQTPPDDVRALMDSWQPYHPGFAVERFHDASAWAFLAQHHPAAVAEAFRTAPEPAMRADLFRLGWLAVRGGIYVDADDRCHGSMLPLLPEGRSLLLYLEDWATVGNNIIAAAPGEPIILAALEEAAAAVARGDRDMVWLSTGPGMLTRVVARQAASPGGLPASMAVVDREAVHATAAMHCFLAYKASERHWSNTTFLRGTRAKG